MGACSSRNDAWDIPDGRGGVIDNNNINATTANTNGDASANEASNNAVTHDPPHQHHHRYHHHHTLHHHHHASDHHLPNFLLELDASDHARARPRRRRRGEHRGLMMRSSSGGIGGSGIGGIGGSGRNRYHDEERLAEIMALQQSLAAMEDFFQSLLGQANFYMDAFDPQNGGGNRGPPPVSKQVLEALPDIDSTHAGAICGICGDEAAETILPCGHVFHRESCIEPWLTRHCTCPACRYELPTDDETYEPGRIERMASRNIEEPVIEILSSETMLTKGSPVDKVGKPTYRESK